MNMGNYDGRFLKMEYTIWLSALIVLVTLATPTHSEPRVVCYYTNWSVYRSGTARFNPQNINPYLCTHLVYAFGGFTKDNTLKPFDKYQDIEKGGYAKFTGLKTYNKKLKTLLAIGGWNEGSARFSPMVATKSSRKEFVKNAIRFLRQNHFDGLDLDWEYPAFRDGGKAKDRENYAKLVKELREEFEKESAKTGKSRLLLTMAVPAGIEYIQKGFDVKTLNRYLDWMNLLTYDYHSAFEPAVNHHAPLYPLEEPSEYSVDNELNIDYTIKFYLENGADRDKLVVGIPTYGRSYTLFNPDAVEIGSPADGPGEQGEATKEKGYLAYYEICEALKPKSRRRRATDSEEEEEEESEESEEEEEHKPWTVMHPNPAAMGPVAYRGNQWVGYDDIDIVRKKAEYVAQNGLGGIMFWSIDNDDFRGACHDKPYPLIEAAKEAYLKGLENTKFIATDTVVKTDSDRRRKNRPRTTTTTTTTTTPKSSKRTSTPSWNVQTPEPPTTPDPGADFKCKDEGFFPHPRDCKKYFWCLDSGPSNLGIVAHQFTCPSGLYFNKAADSCDFARNVLCKVQTTTAKPRKSTTKTTPTTTTSTTTVTTTTRAPVRVSTRNSVLFRTTTTTTPEPEIEDDEEEVVDDDSSDDDAEDPKVIKELIDLIKKVGGVEQLEKQLLLSESSSSTNGAVSTTPTSFNKRLYQKVLDRAIGKNKYTSKTTIETVQQNSRSGPQNAGIEATADKDRLIRKGRPEYVTINRARSSPKTEEPEESEEVEESEEEEVQVSRSKISFGSESSVASTAKPLQYVNIRRARPTTEATEEAEEPSRSRNALFERSQAFVAVDNLNSIDIINTKRDNIPEYVTIKRNRPSYAETTTIGYSSSELDTSKETELEREISSQVSQPQYTNIVRTRSTTQPPQVQPQTPEPTTILSVQISSLLNEPSEEEEPTTQTLTTLAPEIEKPEPEITTIPTTIPTTTTTPAPSSTTSTTRRSLLRRRGSTSPTTTTSTTEAPQSSSQVTRDRRPFRRRTQPTRAPETSTEPIETTTRNLTRGPNRFRNRVQSTTARSDRPTRTYLRRRTGVSAATSVNTTSSATTSSATTSSTSASLTSRRTLFVNRRRPGVTTLSPTTTEPLPNEPTVKTTTLSPTAFIESEEVLQEIGEIDYLEDSTQVTTDLPRTTEYVQRRRPLVQLQIKTEDQNQAATTEEEKKRQSKKYSSSFKQNELNEIIRQRTSGEVVDIVKEGKTNTESYTSETAAAVALAAHQLIAAPVPVTIDYEEDAQSTNEPYKYTTAYTITQQSEDMLKIPAYTSSKKYYDPTSNIYSSVEVENLSTSTYSTDNTNIRSKQRYTTIGGFSGRSSNSQDVVELPSTVPTYTTNAATKASRRLTGRRYRGRTTTTTTDADVISTIQPSTYEPVTDKRGQIKFNGEYVDSFAGFGFGAAKTTDVVRQVSGTQRYASGVNRGSGSRYRINAGVPVTTDSTYEARTTDIRGPEKYKNSVSTFDGTVDVQYNTGDQSNLDVQTDEHGSEKYSTGKYQDSVSTFDSNVDVQSNVGVQTVTDERSSGRFSTGVNRYRISSEAQVAPTDATYEAKITDIRGPAKYSAGQHQGSVSTLVTNEYAAGVQSNANVQYNLGAQSNIGERYSTNAQSNVINIDHNVGAQSNSGGLQSVTSTEVKTSDLRGSEKFATGKYQGSISTNANIQSTAGAPSNTGAWANTDAQSNVNIDYNSNGQVNTGQSVASTEAKTSDIRGSEKYTTGKYEGSISTNADIQSTPGAQSNTGAWVNTDAQSNVNIEYNSNGQINTGQSVASTEVKTTDIRGSEKYTTGKSQGSISTNADIQSTAGAQSNTGAWVSTDAQSNVNIEYNSNGQANSGQSVASTEVKTTDIRGSEKYTTGKYQGSIFTNADIQSTAGVQSNTGAWVNTDLQSNVNLGYNSNRQVNTGQSVASTEVKTTDIRGSEKYTTGKYEGSISTNAAIQSTAGAQFNTGAWVNTDAQSNLNVEYNSNGQANSGQSVASTEAKTTDIRGSEKYTGQSVASTEVKMTDIRGSEKYTTGKYEGSISTNADIQSTAGAQYNTGAWVNTDAQSNLNVEYNSNRQANSGQSVASTEAKTTDIRGSEKYTGQSVASTEVKMTDIRGSEKYTTGKYEGSISTNADIQSTAGAQYNTGVWVNTDAQSNVNLEYNSNRQVNTGQSVASTEVKMTDIRGSEKYTTGKYEGSISTNAAIQSTAGAQFNTGAWVNTDAQSNLNVEYNSNRQANSGQSVASTEAKTTDIRGSEKYTGQSVASTEVKMTDIRGSEKYTTGKYEGSISTNADIQSTAGAQYNTGVWVNTDAQSNVNLEYNSNRQVNTGQSVASTEVKTTDIRGSEKYTTGKYEGSISTNAGIQSTAGAQFNTGAWVNTDAQSNLNVEYNSNGQANSGQSVASTEVKTTDIRGSEKYTGQSVTSTAVKMTDIRGSEKYTTGKYEGSISTNADIQSTAGAQSNTGAWVNTDAQSNLNVEYNSNGQANSGQSVASTEVKTTDIRGSEKYTGQSVTSTEVKMTDIRGSEKYTTGKYEGSISTNADIQSTAGAQSNTGAWVNTDAQSNVNIEYNSSGQINIGQSVASTEVKTTDMRGSEKYTTGKSQGSISTNADIQSTAGAQSNTGAWVNTDAQSNVNLEYNSNRQVNTGQSVASTEVKITDIRGSEKYTTGKYEGSISTNAGIQSTAGAQFNTGAWVDTGAQSNVNIEYNSNGQINAGQSSASTEVKTADIRGSDKYSTGKYRGSISTLEANVDVELTSGLQSNANVQYNLGAQSNTGEWVSTNAQSNLKIESNSNAQADAGQSVTTTEVKKTDMSGSDSYSTGKYQNSISTFGSNVDVQSNAGVHLATDERGSEKYSIGVNNYEISAEVPIITDVKYGATDVRGSEKYKNSFSTFGTNVDAQSNANVQYDISTQSNTGERHIADARSNLNIEYNANAQSDASTQSITSAGLKTTEIRGLDKLSTETNQGSVSRFETNVNKESYSGVQLATDERGSGKYSVARNRYRISTEAPVTTDSTYETRITDTRGSEKYKSSVSTFDTNADVQSNTGTKSNVEVLRTNDEQSAEKYSVDVNKSNISADALGTGTDATYGAGTTDIRGSEKYKTSVSSLETNGNVQLSNAGVQSNLGLQITTDERGSEKYSTETYQSSISLEANKDVQNNANVQYNIDSQFNTGTQSVNAAEVKTTDISGSEKYSSELNQGSVTNFEKNVNAQSNSGVRFTTDERNSGKYSVGVKRYRTTTEAPVTTDSTFEARVTDLRGSEKYKNSVSAFESNVNVIPNARTQSNVGAQISTDEKSAGKYSVQMNRFHVSADKPVTTTDATYGDRTTDIRRGSDKYETSVSTFETNVGVQSNLGVQTVIDERGSEKYSTNKYEGFISLESSKDAQSNANVEYIKDLQSNTGAQSVTSAEVSTSDIRGSDKYTTGSNQGTISSFETNVNVQSNLGVQLETDEGSSGKYSVNVNRYRINAEAPVTTTSTSYEGKTTDVRGSEKYKTSVSTLETNVDVKSNAQSQSNAVVQAVSAERNSEKYSTGKNEGLVSTLGTNTEAQSNVQILNDERRGEKYSMGENRRRIGVKRFRVTTEAPVHSTDATYATSITDMRGSEKYSAGRNKELISTFETNADLQSDVQYNTGAELITPTVPITFGVKTTDISGSDKYLIGGNRRRIGVKRFRVTTEAPVLITDATYATSTTDMRGSEKYSAGRNKELFSTFETNADLQSDINVQYNTGAELITPTVPITFGVKTTDISGSDKYSSGKHEGSAFEANIEIRSNGGFQSVTSPVPVAYEVKTTDQRGPLRYTSGQNQTSILNVETNVDVQSDSGTQSYINLQYDSTAQSNTGIQSNTNARYNANAQSNTGEFRNNNKQSNIKVEYDANALSNANLAYNVDAQSNANIEYNTDAQSNVNLQYNVDAKSEAGVQSVSSTKIKSTDIRGSDKYSTGKYEGSISTLGANVDIQSNEGIQSVSSQVPISYYEVNTTDNRGPMKYAAGEYQSSVSTFEANLQSNGDAQSYANVQYDSNMQTNGDSQYNLNTQSNVNIETNARVQSTVDKQTNTNAQFNANAQFNSHAQNNSSGQYSTDAQSYTNIDYNASAQAINTQYNAGAQSHTGEVKSVIYSVPVIYEMTTTDIQSLEKNSSGKYQTSTFETNVDVQSNAQYNASVQSDAIIQSNTNGQFISSTVPLSYEFNATEIRGPAKYSSGTNKESVTSFQGNANGQSVSSSRPTSYKIRTKGRRPTKFSGGYRNKITNIESDADVISTLQPTTYESQTTDISGETKYSTAEYRDSATRYENTADGISTIQPTISTFEIKTRGPGKYWTGQYRSRTSSSLQTDEDSISTVQPTTYEADTTDIRGSSRYSAEEYRGRVSEVQTNTDIPFVSTIQSYESDTSDTRGPIRYNTVNAYTDGTYNENTDSDVISNRISTTYAPEIVNTRVPTRFTTANAYRGSTVQTDTEIPSTVSTITEYSFDSTLGKSASRTSQTGYRGRYLSEADISGRTDVRQPTRLITGSYSGRGTRPTIASESIDSLTLSGGSSEATQERGAAKYYVTSDITDIREPAQFSSSLDLRGSARFTGSETLTGRTIRPGFLPQNTIDPILSGITINIGAEKGDSTARYNSATDGSATTISASEYESRKSSQSVTNVVSSGDELSINIGESIATTASPSTVKSARPTGFTPSLLNLGEIAEEKSSLKYQISQKSNSYESNEGGPSTARYEENEKIPVPVIYAYSSAGSSSSQSSSSSSSAEPSYFTREYLLESPVTKTYEEEYQYLSPVTIPSTTGRKSIRRKIYRKYNAQKPVENVSTTTTTEAPSPSTEAPTPKRRTTTVKPFQKLTVRRVPLQSVQKITLSKKEIEEAKQKFKPSKDYDYYDDNHEKIAKYDGTKVIVRGEGNIQCLDIGNFPHPTSCKKFISCARIESGAVLGWEYICPKGLSFDPVGGICNWSAGLGCNEKDI